MPSSHGRREHVKQFLLLDSKSTLVQGRCGASSTMMETMPLTLWIESAKFQKAPMPKQL